MPFNEILRNKKKWTSTSMGKTHKHKSIHTKEGSTDSSCQATAFLVAEVVIKWGQGLRLGMLNFLMWVLDMYVQFIKVH